MTTDTSGSVFARGGRRGRRLGALLALPMAIAGWASLAPASVGAAAVTECDQTSSNDGPFGIAAGPSGTVWVTNEKSGTISEYTAASGCGSATATYNASHSNASPRGIVAAPDGLIYFTEQATSVNGGNIGVIDPSSPPSGSNPAFYPLPSQTTAGAIGIAVGPDGRIWAAEYSADKLAAFNTVSHAITEYPVTSGSHPINLTAGPDGTVWFTEQQNSKIGRMTVGGALIAEYTTTPVTSGAGCTPTSPCNSQPYGITAGPDGNVWFTEHFGNRVGRLTPAGAMTEFALPSAHSAPYNITVGPNGYLWTVENNATTGNQLAQIATNGSIVEQGSLSPAASSPISLTSAFDGSLWITQNTDFAGGTPPATVYEIGRYGPLAPPAGTTAAAEGTDGHMWVNNAGSWQAWGGNLLAAPAAVTIHGYAPGQGRVVYIATGTDHHLWWTETPNGWQALSLGAYCIDNPAGWVVGTTMYVACQGGDHALWATTATITGTSVGAVGAWHSLGGLFMSGPAVAVVGGQVTYMGVGLDHSVWTSTGGAWTSTGWACNGHPGLGSDNGEAWFACQGTDGQAWGAVRQPAQSWGAAMPLGGRLINGVGVAAYNGAATILVEGGDRGVWALYVGANGVPLTGWRGLGGVVQNGSGGAGY